MANPWAAVVYGAPTHHFEDPTDFHEFEPSSIETYYRQGDEFVSEYDPVLEADRIIDPGPPHEQYPHGGLAWLATTLTLNRPSAGHPLRGSIRCPTRPLLALDRVGQALARIHAQRAHEHLFGHLVRVGIGAVVAGESLREPHPHPVRGIVGAAVEARGVHERLRELQPMCVRRLPIRTHTPKAAPQHPRRQVRNPLRLGQNQKPCVVPNQMQPPKLHRAVPAQPPVARRALERLQLPAQQRQPVPAPHRNVAQPPARELPEPQIVVLVHERVPAPPLIRARQPHLNLAHHHLHLVERIRHAPGDALQNSQPSALLSGHHRLAASVK